MRACRREKLVMFPLKATTSPSTMKSSTDCFASASANSGYESLIRFRLRDIRRTLLPRRNVRTRSPSNFFSKIHSSSEKMSSVSVANIGAVQDAWRFFLSFFRSSSGRSLNGSFMVGLRLVYNPSSRSGFRALHSFASLAISFRLRLLSTESGSLLTGLRRASASSSFILTSSHRSFFPFAMRVNE